MNYFFLQETLITEDKPSNLHFIDKNYEVVRSGSVYSERALESNARTSEEGLACLWKRSALFKVQKVIIEKSFIVMSLLINGLTIVFVNVYIKSDLGEVRTLNDYLELLIRLEILIESLKFDSTIFICDFNADPLRGRAFGNSKDFISRNDLRCFDVDILDEDTFTFLSYRNSFTKWLDHVIGRTCNNADITNVKVLYDKLGSDHFPMVMQFNVDIVNSLSGGLNILREDDIPREVVDWDRLDLNEFSEIENASTESLEYFFRW